MAFLKISSPTTEGQNPRFVVHADENYDFTAMRQNPKPTNVFESAAHIVKGCLGGGIMGIHVAFSVNGLWNSTVWSILFGLFNAYCVSMMVNSAQVMYRRLHITSLSYADLMEACIQVGPFQGFQKYSKFFRYFVDFVICVDLFGSCCVYEIMIGRTIVQLVKTYHGEPIVDEEGNAIPEKMDEVRIYVIIILIPIILLCLIRSLKYLAPFSIIADFFIVLTVFSTVYYSLTSPTRGKLSEMPTFGTLDGFFRFSGVVVFSMGGIGVALPIENNMKVPKNFKVSLAMGYSVVASFVTIVGFFGYWGFGTNCKAPVTLNLPTGLYPSTLKALMGLMIYATFALNFWAPFNLCWFYISRKYPAERHWIWERVYRTIMVLIITVIALIFPQITSLMGLLGGLCLSNMTFMWPAMIETLVIWNKPGLGAGNWKLIKNVLIFIFGVIVFCTSGFYNGKELIENLMAKQTS